MRDNQDAEPTGSIRERILNAAFKAIIENGAFGSSTLDIANGAKVSKRDLYALFGNKDEILLACIEERATAISGSLKLPDSETVTDLARILQTFGYRLLKATTRSEIIAAFRFAIARSQDLPAAARAIDRSGRRASRAALGRLLKHAIEHDLIRDGDMDKMIRTYFGLLWADLQVGLLMGVSKAPSEQELQSISSDTAETFISVYGYKGKSR